MTAAAIYRHFDSKDVILATVLDQAVQELLDASQSGLGDGDGVGESPDRALRALTRAMLSFASERTSLHATYVRERDRLTGPAEAAARRAEARLTERWHEAAAEAGAVKIPATIAG